MKTWFVRFSGPLGIWLAANLILSMQINNKLDLSQRAIVCSCMVLAVLSGAWWGWIRAKLSNSNF